MPKEESFEEFRRRHNHCPSCEVLMINGVRCHEHGCPERAAEIRRLHVPDELEDLDDNYPEYPDLA